MTVDEEYLEKPVLYHMLKHQASYIKALIQNNKIESKEDKAIFCKTLKKIGNSQMDLYIGDLSAVLISSYIIDFLKERYIIDENDYKEWINSNGGYQLITLPDSSVFVFRIGDIEGHYVHLHPARWAPHTIRVRATALKTAIATLVFLRNTLITIEKVNQIRIDYLSLPPSKKLYPDEGAGKLLLLLFSDSPHRVKFN